MWRRNSAEVHPAGQPSQWIVGYVDSKSGFGEVAGNNTREVEEEERGGKEKLSG